MIDMSASLSNDRLSISSIASPVVSPRSAFPQFIQSTWAEISLARLRRNFALLQEWVGPGVKVCAMVKGDAYGHGLIACARALESAGAQWLGAAGVNEAVLLRDAGIRSRILLVTGFCPGEQEEIVRHRLTPVIWDHWQVLMLERAAIRLGFAKYQVHLKVDTGMNRLGVNLHGLEKVLDSLHSAPHLLLEGVLTHLASAECLDQKFTEQQIRRFALASARVQAAGFSPAFTHMANSCAVIAHKQTWKNMVRPGLALFGYHLPFTSAGKPTIVQPRPRIAPVLTWKTRILSVRRVRSRQPLSYNGTFTTVRPSTIAVLPIGYADGLNRRLSSRARVVVRGCYAPIVGRITMNLTQIDVTDLSCVDPGDEVILLGSSGGLNVDAHEHASLAGTIPQEILCNLSQRVPRMYTETPVV